MKRDAGFTLIELVVVIIILGILAVTAAPKFINLQSDARASTLQGMKASLESAATLVYAKAAVDGVENDDTGSKTVEIDSKGTTVNVKYGYPVQTAATLQALVDADPAKWNFTDGVVQPADFTPVSGAFCQVNYAEAVSGARPVISVSAAGC